VIRAWFDGEPIDVVDSSMRCTESSSHDIPWAAEQEFCEVGAL
jgi:hypothetical protein